MGCTYTRGIKFRNLVITRSVERVDKTDFPNKVKQRGARPRCPPIRNALDFIC